MEFTGCGELQKKLSEIAEKYPAVRDRALVQEAELLVNRTKANTPVDTGTLRNGWKRTQPKGGAIEVYNNTDYVNHVEYGHRLKDRKTHKFKRFVPGKKMLHTGMDSIKTTFKEDMKDILQEVFK